MAGLSKLVAYELYTLEYAGWTLHARYTSAELEDAMTEAKTIEATLQRATKVVRETYYPEDNHTDEAVVRISPNIAEYKRRLVAARQRPAQVGVGTRGDDLRLGGGDARELGTSQILARMTMMVFSALVIAAAVTAVVSLVLRTQLLATKMSSSTVPQILFVTFVLVFLLSALPLVSRYIPALTAREPEDDAKRQSQAFLDMPGRPETPQPDPAKPAPASEPALFKNDPGLIAQEAAPPKAEEKKAEKEKKPEKKAEEPKKPEKQPEPPKAEPPPPEPEIETPPEIAAIATLERQRIAMMRFLTGLLTALKEICPQLDAYSRFGLDLIVAGACAELGRREDLREADVFALTSEAVTMLGSKPALTEAFVRKIDVHATDPRYAQMIAQGARALAAFADGAASPFEPIATAMRGWTAPGDRITGSTIVTILFTDMVGSTQLTQDRGDNAAHGTVRLHNAIVRAALAEHEGVEVKHTGDGIMASFAAPSQAVEAAAAIQRAVRDHNAADPAQAFHLRIGINSGEPIIEDDDMFGAAVQLAARVCGEAEPDTVLVGNVVRELVSGKGFAMTALPPRALRGIAEPQVLHVVDWAAPPAQQAPAEPAQTAETEEKGAQSPGP